MTQNICIRLATPADALALLDVYAPYIRQTAITFEYDVPSIEEFTTRIEQTLTRYPYLVAEVDGAVAGYAYASPFHARAAYGWDTELSIYLQPGLQRHRLGSRLYRVLIALLHAQNVVNAYACITSPGPSIAFHESLGFQKIGTFPRTGWKFECWHDVVWMELPLRQRVTTPETFIPFPELDEETVRHLLNDPV